MRDFAKMFRSEKYGQLVILLDRNDDGDPSVRVHFQHPNPTFGVCSVGPHWDDDDAGWHLAEKAFERLSLEIAEGLIEIAGGLIGRTV